MMQIEIMGDKKIRLINWLAGYDNRIMTVTLGKKMRFNLNEFLGTYVNREIVFLTYVEIGYIDYLYRTIRILFLKVFG